jgi:hypothetical protein
MELKQAKVKAFQIEKVPYSMNAMAKAIKVL